MRRGWRAAMSAPVSDAAPRPPGRIVWADEEARALLGGCVGELQAPRPAAWEQVKHSVSRTVLRGRLAGRQVYLKRFHSPSPLRRLLRRLGVCDALRELRFSQYLLAHGVPTPRALAACAGAEEWLVTEAVAPAEPADAWHERQLRAGVEGAAAVRRAAAAMGRLVGRMHAAGVVHRDLHCGNVLVRTGGDAEGGELVLMDLHRVRRGRLSRRARAANLAQLLHDRYHATSRSDRLRFLKHYLAASGAAGSLRGWAALVEHLARIHTRRQHRGRDARVFGDGKYFARVRLGGGWRGHVVLASKRRMAGSLAAEGCFTQADWAAALARPEDLLSAAGAKVVKDSPSTLLVRRRIELGGRQVDVFVKRTRRRQAWKAVLDCFRPARAVRAFALGHALLTRRIATPLPLAALECRRGPLLLDSILITEAVDAPRLGDFVSAWLGGAGAAQASAPLSGAERRRLVQGVLDQLGRLLAALHDSRFAHRDMKASNLLVRWDGRAAAPELVLLDLDGLSRRRLLTARRRFQGLMRLNVSLLKCHAVNRAGRLRMLLAYLRRPGAGTIDYKPYWRMLEDWSARKLRQQIRSRRRRQKAERRPNP